MDMLGPLLPFLDSDVLSHMDREALKLQLEELKQYCFPSDTFRQISALLTERSMLGWDKVVPFSFSWQPLCSDFNCKNIVPHWASKIHLYWEFDKVLVVCNREPKTWTVGDVEHVGRLLFTLSPQQIRSLPLVKGNTCLSIRPMLSFNHIDLLNFSFKVDLGRDTVEQVLMSQWLWKNSEVGKACLDLKGLQEKMNGLLHRIIKGQWWMRRGELCTESIWCYLWPLRIGKSYIVAY